MNSPFPGPLRVDGEGEWLAKLGAKGTKSYDGGSADAGEFVVDDVEGEGFEGLVAEFFDRFHRESLGDDAAGGGGGDATGLEVVDLFGADWAGGGPVRTLDLVGIDLKARHGVGFAHVGHEEIPAGLVGVGVVGAFIDEDEAGEDCFGLPEEGIFEKEVAEGVGGTMVLEGALVVFLARVWNGDRENFGMTARAVDCRVGFLPSPASTGVDGANASDAVFFQARVGQAGDFAV